MKILYVETTNFGSFPEFKMDFTDVNLALIYGDTGSGKSTVMDMVCWCLYGETAKGLASDEVRSWQAEGATTGHIVFETNEKVYSVNRIRSSRANQNDLYFVDEANPEYLRGKDATETQKLISQKIGMDSDTFVTASYFHEFSETGNFFIAKAKDRRTLFEKLAPLDFPKNLAEKATLAKKVAKYKLQEKEADYQELNGKLKQIITTKENNIRSMANWDANHANALIELDKFNKNFLKNKERKLSELQEKLNNFETYKNSKIDSIVEELEDIESKISDKNFLKEISFLEEAAKKEHKCKSCNQNIKNEKNLNSIWELKQKHIENENYHKTKVSLLKSLEEAQEIVNSFDEQIVLVKNQENPYLLQIKTESARVNPFELEINTIEAQLAITSNKLTLLNLDKESIASEIEDISHLYDLSSTLRAELLKRTVGEINENINNTLEKFFDSELRVSLILDEDDLEARIEKSGNDCSFRQLSKGQRQLLRLSFVLATQKATSDKLGIKLENLFFDEALDGLDEGLKIKAYSLFESLSLNHESILIIDHSKAFQGFFNKKYHVTMQSDKSRIEGVDE